MLTVLRKTEESMIMIRKTKDIKSPKYNFKNALSEMNNRQQLDIEEEMNEPEDK